MPHPGDPGVAVMTGVCPTPGAPVWWRCPGCAPSRDARGAAIPTPGQQTRGRCPGSPDPPRPGVVGHRTSEAARYVFVVDVVSDIMIAGRRYLILIPHFCAGVQVDFMSGTRVIQAHENMAGCSPARAERRQPPGGPSVAAENSHTSTSLVGAEHRGKSAKAGQMRAHPSLLHVFRCQIALRHCTLRR